MHVMLILIISNGSQMVSSIHNYAENDREIPHIDKSPYNNAAPPSTSAITSLSAVPFAASADAATSKQLAIAFPL